MRKVRWTVTIEGEPRGLDVSSIVKGAEVYLSDSDAARAVAAGIAEYVPAEASAKGGAKLAAKE